MTQTTNSGVIDASQIQLLDVGGATVQHLVTSPNGAALLRGVLAPGVFVPLHGHEDPETFVLLSGEVDSLVLDGRATPSWQTIGPADVVNVAPNARHAFRNASTDQSATFVIATTTTLARFFADAGRPVAGADEVEWPPTLDTAQRLAETSARYGFWIGTPEENAEVGLALGPPPDATSQTPGWVERWSQASGR